MPIIDYGEPLEVNCRSGRIGASDSGERMLIETRTAEELPYRDYPRLVECANALAGCNRPAKLPDLLRLCDQIVAHEAGDVPALLVNLKAALAELRGSR